MDSQQEVKYFRFESPINTIANKQPTGICDVVSGAVVIDVPQNTRFVAVGRAQSGESNYFMDAESFGEADKTGEPAAAQGINSIDLTLNPEPEAEAIKPAEDSAQKIDVRVGDDPGKFKRTFTHYLGPVPCRALGDNIIHDLEGIQPDVSIKMGQPLTVGGSFYKDGIEYYRTVSSVKNDTWYGIPTELCTRNIDLDEEESKLQDDVDRISDEVLSESNKEKMIRAAASTGGFLTRLFGRKRKVIE